MTEDDRAAALSAQSSNETWEYRGYTDGYCGQRVDLLDHERSALRHTPGLVPLWETDRDSERSFEQFWFRCPLTGGHEGPHGTYVAYRRWRSNDDWCPVPSDSFDSVATDWYLLWGRDETDRRVLGPMASCPGSKPADGVVVDGEWFCSLWHRHPGTCRFCLWEIQALDDFDFDKYLDDDESSDWKVDWAEEVLVDYRSGEASEADLMDAHHLSSQGVRDLIETMRPHYESRWSDDDLLRIVRRYLLDPDAPNSATRFDEWKREFAPDGPSFQTLRNRLGRGPK